MSIWRKWHTKEGQPDLSDTPFHPVVLEAGEDLLIECIVHNLGDNSILWKRTMKNVTEILTADTSRVISDKRVSVIHNPGSEEWLLTIEKVNITDSGTYACETNLVPSIPAFRNVIITSHLPPAPADPDMNGDLAVNTNHTYTDCCKKKGVRKECLKFCSFRSLVSGNYDPSQCLEYLPTFGECMADGRDHTPCCREQQLPPICSELCRGQYKISTMVEHYSCNPHITSLLACISEGIELLPSQPEHVMMEATSPSSINVSWTPPRHTPQGISHYIIAVKKLNSFDGYRQTQINGATGQVNSDQTYWTLDALDSFTMYEVTVKAENKYGSSQPSNPVRGVTMISNSPHILYTKKDAPAVPDIQSCCIRKGLDKNLDCVQKLCNPEKSDQTKTEDFITCAPYVNITFSCLANGVDHTDCCLQRGIPNICKPLCSGTVSKISYTHFICVNYMPALTNCVLQSYGVLPSAPRDLTVTVHPKWVLIQWSPPLRLYHTIKSYHLHYRKYDENEKEERYNSPYLLENLDPNSVYEVYVSPVNKYGLGEGSPRLVITTPEALIPVDGNQGVNKTTELSNCCKRAGISDECLPLCDYRAPFSTLLKLGPKCEKYSHIVVRCSAAGRDHTFCCVRKNIPSKCVSLCAGYSGHLSDGRIHECNPHLPKMVECMEEGIRTLPGIPRELYSDGIKPTELSLKWSPPAESGVVSNYEVYIRGEDFINKKVEPYRLAANVKVTEAALKDLIPGNTYGLYVVSGNKFGTSLPSYVVNIRMPFSEVPTTTGVIARAKPGSPSGFEVKDIRLYEIDLYWRPTVHVHPDDEIKYIIYFTVAKGDEQSIDKKKALNVTTEYHKATLKNLKENTDYFIWGYTLAKSNSTVAKSLKSDILLVRTDHPVPAIVDGVQLMPSSKYHLEGTSLTALCATTGRPEPMISLFLDGKKLVENIRLRLTAQILNVSRHMKEVICHAENGYGAGGVKVAPINVVYPPTITTPKQKVKVDNSLNVLTIECHVTANPQPHTAWYRYGKNGQVIISSPRHLVSIATKYHDDDYPSYIMSLKIAQLTAQDYGEYHCHAENQYGTSTSAITLVEENVRWNNQLDVTECCKANNVSEDCIDACVFDIDIQRALNKPKCIPELEKMMRCASDGSDHRRCCLGKGVERSCLNWCRGYRVTDAPLCILGYAKQIVDCFEEGNSILPGPPKNLKFEMLPNKTVELSWDAPNKNTEFVELYRLFWKQKGNKFMGFQVPVTGKYKKIPLDPGTVYEFVVKAYNHYGKSMPSNKVEVRVSEILTQTNLASQSKAQTGTALICITVLFVLLVLCIAAFIIRKKFFGVKGVRSSSGVAFENPSYLKDSTTGNESSRNGVTLSSLTNGLKSRPNVYEELKVPT
ncbi:Ig-like and fibronectin type-III domain-containing protein 2 [Nymphon striatum]|nr:Ig-like and fibronectin type-III domain-containing protein 2 [Nymphon striatum]